MILRKPANRIHLVLAGILLLLSASCAGMSGARHSAGADCSKLPAAAPDPAWGGHEEYSKALELYERLYDRCRDEEVRSGYRDTGIRIKKAADRAFQGRNYAKAGRLYGLLAASRITASDFTSALTFDGEYLKKQIMACSKSLTEAGLIRYREERLEEAITIWESVLAFDPENKAIQQAIETATRQRRALKKIE